MFWKKIWLANHDRKPVVAKRAVSTTTHDNTMNVLYYTFFLCDGLQNPVPKDKNVTMSVLPRC